ncbi:MAG: helix-turn-helix domain-containing protein [Terracidiphilus sp.]
MSNQPIFVLHETADCPTCGLHEYLTENGQCRRCGRPLGIEYLKLPVSDLARSLSDEKLRVLPNQVGTTIRNLRARRGISQEKLARASGTGRSHLSRIECGHVIPPLSLLLRLTVSLGLSTVLLRFENARLSSTSRTTPHD